ncbi:SCO family protein [Paracoccus contaminans]|uniref:SCO family protein n=1 Tax=Paracoccus contaminans TaxID=1945662 RepID=A0A1W6CWJ7_9RHOB|nr:SCO family protein [Paracoccus contaminans]ARJ69253.1 SCO family protein [Paracoccus contaminans]
MTTERRLLILGVAATALLLLTGFMWMRSGAAADPFGQCRRSAVAGGAGALGGPFTLTDENGARVTDAQVFNRPSLFYIGYTFCPDVCPMDNARNAAAVELLRARGTDARAVFMSVDPARDTPERMRDYTDMIDPGLLGLTGSADDVAAVAKAWRAYFKLNNETDKSDYLVDHTTQSYLVLPGHGTVEFFSRDTSPQEMADTVSCFVDAAKS